MVIDSVLEVRGIIFVYTIIVMRNVLEGQQMVTAELTAYLSTHRDGYGAASPARSHQGAWIFPNVGYFFLALFVGTLFAFWPPYLSHLPNTDVNAHFHGIVAVIWCGLLIAPPLLIRTNRALHRRLGTFSKAVAPLFIVEGILLAHHRVGIMSKATFAVRAPSLYLGLAATVLFAASYLLALRYSRRQALHARFMIATGLTMIDPVVVRLFSFYTPTFSHPLMYQVWGYGLTDFLLLVLLWRPTMRAQDRGVFLRSALLFPIAHLAWFTIVQGPLWTPFAFWFRSLPLP